MHELTNIRKRPRKIYIYLLLSSWIAIQKVAGFFFVLLASTLSQIDLSDNAINSRHPSCQESFCHSHDSGCYNDCFYIVFNPINLLDNTNLGILSDFLFLLIRNLPPIPTRWYRINSQQWKICPFFPIFHIILIQWVLCWNHIILIR